MARSFIFGGNTGETAESLKRKRSVAEALAASRGAPRNVGEGLSAIGNAIAYRMLTNQIGAGEKAGKASADSVFSRIAGALSPQKFPAAPFTTDAPGAGATVSSAAPDMTGNAIYSEFMDTVKAGGVTNPNALAAIASTGKAESGFSPGNVYRTWADPSQSGEAGTAGGIMSWRGPRLQSLQNFVAANGGDPRKPSPALQAQYLLQEDPSLIQKLQAAQSPEEAQQLMNNAWRFAGYDQPGGEAERRLGVARGFLSTFGDAGPVAAGPEPAGALTQVASLDPTAGVAEALAKAGGKPMPPGVVGEPAAVSPAGVRVLGKMMDPEPMAPLTPFERPAAPALSPPQTVQDMPVAQVAQAQPDLSQVPITAGGAAGAYQPGQGPSLQMLLEAAGNEFLSDGQRGVINALIQQQMQQSDPKTQLEIQKLQRELSAPPERKTTTINGRLIDTQTGQEVASFPEQTKPTSDIQEYEYAKQQGFQGGLQEWITANKRAGATNVNVGAGEKAWDQESAKLFAKRYDDISAGAMNAQQMIGMYDLAEEALATGVRTGVGGEAELTLRQLGAAMGMDTDPEKLAGGELIRSVQNRMALTMRSPDGGMGMPGALSDRDIKFLKDSQIGIDRSPEGNARMLKAFRALEQRKIQIAQLADQYVQENGRLDAGFNQSIAKWAESNPLFPQTPQAGQIEDGYRFKGGDPSDPANWERQ